MITKPTPDHRKHLAAAEQLSDIAAFDCAIAALVSGEDEAIPAAFADRLIGGESPVLVFRELRGLTQAALAEICCVGRLSIEGIEAGWKQGSVATIGKLADVLGVEIADLI